MEENIAAAVRAVHQDKLNVLTASKIFGVSRTTLRRRLINPFPNNNGGQTKIFKNSNAVDTGLDAMMS